MNNPPRVISSLIALAGFLVALVAGLAVDNPPGVILTNALACMIGCKLLGAALGSLAHSMVTQHVERYRAQTPIPATAPARAERVIYAEPEESPEIPHEKKRAA